LLQRGACFCREHQRLGSPRRIGLPPATTFADTWTDVLAIFFTPRLRRNPAQHAVDKGKADVERVAGDVLAKGQLIRALVGEFSYGISWRRVGRDHSCLAPLPARSSRR
jgi:hypothetical protein